MRKAKTAVAALLAVASASAALPALAQSASDVQYKFSGFGTVGAVVQGSDVAEFRIDPKQAKGAGTTPDFGVDTRAGFQASAIINPEWTVTGQVYAVRYGSKDLDPQVEWFFAQYKAAPWLDVRAGRMVLPAYLVSDFRNVGYAMPWLRAPIEIYSGLLFSHYDGFQAIARFPVGDGQITVQPSYGKASADVAASVGNIVLSSAPVGGVNVAYERDSLLLRVGQVRGNTKQTLGTRVLGNPNDSYSSAGLQFDNGSALLMAEYARRKTSDGSYDSNAWYTTVGWRFGAWLPNATYGMFRPDGPRYPNGKATDSVALGVRYEAAKNVALKAQVERRGIDSNSFLVANRAAYSDKVNMLSLAADFVF